MTRETEIADIKWRKPRIAKGFRPTCLLKWVKDPLFRKSCDLWLFHKTCDFGGQRTWVKWGTLNFRGKGAIYTFWRDSSTSIYLVLTMPNANTQNGFISIVSHSFKIWQIRSGASQGNGVFRLFSFHCIYRKYQLQIWSQIPLENEILHAFENRSLYILLGTDISLLPLL